MCGMRRGEIVALSWDDVKWDQDKITVTAIEQTKAGCREKETKGSKCGTVAMPALLIEELKAWRVRQAQEFLRLGMRPDGNTRVVTQADGSSPTSQPNSRDLRVPERAGQRRPIAWTPPQPRQSPTGRERPPQDRAGTARALQHRDHDGHLLPPDAEHAGRRRRQSGRRLKSGEEATDRLRTFQIQKVKKRVAKA